MLLKEQRHIVRQVPMQYLYIAKKITLTKFFEFAKKFIKSKYFKPMVSVPSSYSKTYEKDLIKNGFKIIIYANHMMRAFHTPLW